MTIGLGLSTTFNPGVANAKANGANIHAGVYAQGDAGVEQSCRTIAEKIRLGSQDPRVIGWGDQKLKAAGIDGRDQPSDLQKAAALLEAFREQVVYRADPPGTEYIQSAHTTLCLGPGLCLTGGDCDDMVVALGSVLLAQSVLIWVVKQSYGADAQQHVLLGMEQDGVKYYVDPSTRAPISTQSMAESEVWFDPLDYKGVTGTAHAEIVTLGRPLRVLGFDGPAPMGFGAPAGATPISLDPAMTLTNASSTAASGPSIAGPYAQAQQDLNNQISAVIAAGDTYFASAEYTNAIQAYMAAGNAGVTDVGPEIDLAGSPNVTSPWTQAAAAVNTQLQAQGQAAIAAGQPTSSNTPTSEGTFTTTSVTVGTPSQADATTAQAQAKQMEANYQVAIVRGSSRPNTVKGPGAAPLVQSSTPYWIIGGLALVGGVAWGVARSRRRR